uniref:Uncharacterized protein n=1 Tax=Tanacetum cinerariifolium TaxID=118510 RepID=A0A699KI22_TANCI|nr:hypothetical protein [Tanacetum cinerariifolium]
MEWWPRVYSMMWRLALKGVWKYRVVRGIQGGDEVVWLALELKGGDGGACGLLGDMGVKPSYLVWGVRSMKWWLRVDSMRWRLALKGVQRCRMVRGIQGGDEVVWLALELKGGDGGTCGLLGDVGVKVVVRSWC